MLTPLLEHISKYIEVNNAEAAFIREHIPVQTFAKDTVLLQEGEISKTAYFNIKGCVRLYCLINGEERTTFFYTEGQFIASYQSFTKQIPSAHSLKCLEDTTLAVIPFEAEKQLLQQFPKFEHLSRLLLEEELCFYQEMVTTFIALNPEERYLHLLKNQPELIHRIPQYHLATYLGITPVSLSRIRKRILGKDAY